MGNYDQFQLAVEGNGNKVLYDDRGLPSVMVPVPKFNLSEINAEWPDTPHPAFIVNGVTVPVIYISKYQNVVNNDRAYSLPMRDPRAAITFDVAKAACEAKGAGWHLMSNAEWAAIALWCRKHELMPRGNNNYGQDIIRPDEKGIPTLIGTDGRPNRVATGSGPVSWAHDGSTKGIWDLNGNVAEWVSGYRTLSGEIQIIPDNNSALGTDEKSTSTLWKAILQDGSLVDPGSVGTVKWDYIIPVPEGGTSTYGFRLNTVIDNPADNDTAQGSSLFSALTTAAGVTAPDLLKYLGVFPMDDQYYGGDFVYMRNRPGMERLAYRGSSWNTAAAAGVFCLACNYQRSRSLTSIGFRSAFIDLTGI